MQTEVIKLTPDLSAQFIKTNQKNRPLAGNMVKAYADAIKRGDWQLNGEPIVFDSDGAMIDGQHRCAAVIRAGKAIDVLVVRGVDPSSFVTMDAGRKRTVGDVLSCNGEKSANILAAAAKAYAAVKAGQSIRNYTPTMAMSTINECPALRYWANQYSTRRRLHKLFTSGLAGALCAGAEVYGQDPIMDLMEKLESGIGLEQGDPALLLREKFVERKTGVYFSQEYALGLYIKVIAAHCQHRKMKQLRISSQEATIPSLK